jgi:hypothetical protein
MVGSRYTDYWLILFGSFFNFDAPVSAYRLLLPPLFVLEVSERLLLGTSRLYSLLWLIYCGVKSSQ